MRNLHNLIGGKGPKVSGWVIYPDRNKVMPLGNLGANLIRISGCSSLKRKENNE